MLVCQLDVLAKSVVDATFVPSSFLADSVSATDLLKAKYNNDSCGFDLFSHDRSQELMIQGEWKDAKAIVSFLNSQFVSQNAQFKSVNIYGCEFAKGEQGKQAVVYLEKHLNVKVNASTNITRKNGDGFLQYRCHQAKGIAVNRLIARDYGESQLINRCRDAISCTDIEQQNNRPNEFIAIIK